MKRIPIRRISSILFVGFIGTLLMAGSTWALDPNILRIQAPLSLKRLPVPEPQNLGEYVVNKQAAIVLGKALFWDMQLGSDGIQACASCHFQAGVDIRAKNQINPGLAGGDTTFQAGSPNATLLPSHFPFHERVPPDFQKSPIVRNINDVTSSMGVFNTQFIDIVPGSAEELVTVIPDPVFNVGGVNTRRVAGRNAPSSVNAIFYWNNFWDGRAHNTFNGVNPFGPLDMNARIWANNSGVLEQVPTEGLNNASLASQAVGPPGSDFEMSAAGRPFPKIGKKMLSLTPLGKQLVHPNDSALGPFSRAQLAGNRVTGQPGLNATYIQLIQQAFNPKYWSATDIIVFNNNVPTVLPNPGRPLTTNEFTQGEVNFSLFFGLAVQLYEATLVSDDAPFDRFADGDDNALTQQQLQGLDYFLNVGKCVNCHGGAEFTNATVSMAHFRNNGRHEVINWLRMKDGGEALYDDGNYNVSVRPTADDIGKGAMSPFINPLTGDSLPLSLVRLAKLQLQGLLPFSTPQLSAALSVNTREAINGAFKTPTMRNVELTGPYFHNGSAATLHEAMDVYIRGGNFPYQNLPNVPEDIHEIQFLQGHDDRHDALVAFLKALTDERVRQEMAPFDRPQIFIPNGHPGNENGLTCVNGEVACDDLLELPPVGAGGRFAAGLPPLREFLFQSPIGPLVDFNEDGKTDTLWWNGATGQAVVWLMNGTTLSATAEVGMVPDTNWKSVGAGDFNGDGNGDILWRNEVTGQNVIWLMNGITFNSSLFIPGVSDTNWRIAGTGHFNNDGSPDILWHHTTAGAVAIWLMNGTTVSNGVFVGGITDTNWKVARAGDFNGDGQADILWRNNTTGQNAVWLMSGTALDNTVNLSGVPDVNWEIVGAADFNADGQADILWRNNTTGQNVVWLMNGTTYSSSVFIPALADTNWKITGP